MRNTSQDLDLIPVFDMSFIQKYVHCYICNVNYYQQSLCHVYYSLFAISRGIIESLQGIVA